MSILNRNLYLFIVLALSLNCGTSPAFGSSKVAYILSVNDFHGKVTESSASPGAAKLASQINAIRASHNMNDNNHILVLAGDNYQGSLESYIDHGNTLSEIFKYLSVSASAVGNHEFDWGKDHFPEWSKIGGFPFLASNITINESDPLPYKIYNLDGIKIAILGLTTQETLITTPHANLNNVSISGVSEAAKKYTHLLQNKLKPNEKPDVIIALTHVGSFQDNENNITGYSISINGTDVNEMEELSKVEGIDAIISGHTHQTVNGRMNNKVVVQAAEHGKKIGFIKIEMSNTNNQYNKNNITIESEVIPVDPNITGDTFVENKVHQLKSSMQDEFSKEIGYSKSFFPAARSSHTGVSLIAQYVMKEIYETYGKQQNLDAVIFNGGQFRADINQGPITITDLYNVMPYDNTLAFISITGKNLRDIVDHSISLAKGAGQFYGLDVVYDSSRDPGERIVSLSHNGNKIEDHKHYRIAISSFMYPNGDLYNLSHGKHYSDSMVILRDILIDTIKRDKMISDKTIHINNNIIDLNKDHVTENPTNTAAA